MSVLQTRSMTCWPPVVTRTSCGSTSRALGGHDLRRSPRATSAMPSVGAVLQRAGASPRPPRCDMQRGERLGREGRGVGQAAGERDDLGALGDGHQVAHRRGLHDRACARRRGRRSARGRGAVGRASAVRRGPERRASSRVMPPDAYRTVKLFLDISRASASPPRPASARSCPRCSPALWPRPTSASTSTAPTSPSSSSPGSWLVARRRARRHDRCCGARRRRRPASAALGGIAIGARRAAVRRRRSPTTARRWWPGLIVGLAVRRARPARRAQPVRRARARASTREAAAALPIYAEGVALVLAGAGDPRPAASRSSLVGFLVWLLSAAAAASGEKYAGLRILSSDHASSSSRSSTGSSRRCSSARCATGRAPALAAIIERGTLRRRAACAAFPSVTPVCAATIATGGGPGRATTSRR